MLGLMQDRPLLISSLIEHADNISSRRADRLAHLRRSDSSLHLSRHPSSREAACAGADCAGRATRRARRDAGMEQPSAYRAVLRRVRHGRGAAHDQSAPVSEQIAYIANHAEDQYVFFDIVFAPLIETARAVDDDGQGFRRDDRSRAHAEYRRREPAVLRRADRRARRRIMRGRNLRRRKPHRCATPRVPPAIPRACCIRIARRCCTPS